MEDSTPILVGGGQFTEKEFNPESALPPMGIAAEAAKAALADTGKGDSIASHIDTIISIRIFPDSTNRPRLQIPFGRAENPPRAVAHRIGANPVNAIYGNVGGNTPQKYINEMAERITAGDVGVVLLAGSEAIKTAQTALRNDIMLDWQEDYEGSQEDRGLGEKLFTPHEFAHGVGIPIQTYPLFENALRQHQGFSIEEHMQQMGSLFEKFSEVAANNPYSFYGTRRTAEELTTITPENRWIGFPYPKWMNAMDGVNLGAAVIMTSVGKAKELGIDPGKWVYLHGCAEANEKINVTDRVNYYSAPAIGVNTRAAMAMAGIEVDDINYFDFYSCFPSAVELTCDELGLAYDDPRGFTLTGGLPFFGGPGNNYSTHGLASMLPLLRANPGHYGMVTANGGYLSKHSTGIYSAKPFAGKWERESPSNYQHQVDDLVSPDFTEAPAGPALIETYTVCFVKGSPDKGIVIGRLTDSGQRFVANTPVDQDLLTGMTISEQIGRPGTVSNNDGMNLFIPA
ncbi:MAG: acetyl-CoA acetyltransferase [Pseudomonadales bacterium]|nr:acetyl-CoA acetyltransferase [Pseudomonadales bacterium]